MLQQLLETHIQQTAQIKALVQEAIKNTTTSLDERWALFEFATKARVLPMHGYIQHTPTLDKLDVSWYDDFYKERYATVMWTDIVEQIAGNGPENYDGSENKFHAPLDQIKEEILAAGYAGFELDW